MTQKVTSPIRNYQINPLARERIDAASDIPQSPFIYVYSKQMNNLIF